MTISGYIESANEVFYHVVNEVEGQDVTEQISAKQLLATRPALTEIYEYVNDVTIESRVEHKIEKCEAFPQRMKRLIIDYLEESHVGSAMQLIENVFGLGKKPPYSLLLSLLNMILKPKDEFKRKSLQKEHWLNSKRAHGILMDVLSLYGPEIYLPVWNEFKYFRLAKIRVEKDEDFSDMDTHELGNYDDYWDFTDKLLNEGTENLDSKCRRLVLDFFVNMLQMDLKTRLSKQKNIKTSIFYKVYNSGNTKNTTKILFKNFPHKDENLYHLSGDILNMLITISCFEETDVTSLVFAKFEHMNAETCTQLMQVVKYPTFIIELCDRALANVDVSRVEQSYLHYQHSKHVPLQLEKVLFYAFKTLPRSLTLADIYRHVIIVSKYCMCIFSTASVNHKRVCEETNSALSEEQLELLISHQDEVLGDWDIMLEQVMHDEDIVQDLKIKERIRWAVKLTRLTVIEYL